MEYHIMELPFGAKDFMYFSKEEAESYFNWFMVEIPNRLNIFKGFFLSFSENVDIFDYSVESLDAIWRWYLKYVIIEDVEPEVYQKKLEKTHEHIRPYIPTKQLGVGWTQIAVDIGIYFSQCLLKHCSQLRWGVETEPPDLYIVNRPAVEGFNGDSFEPIHVMLVMSDRVVDGDSSESALSKLFDTWMSKPKEPLRS